MSRLYEEGGRQNPAALAESYCRYVFYHSGVEMEELGLDLLLESGRVKEAYGLAPTDCMVLAAAKRRRCKALFRHREKEMGRAGDSLLRNFEVVFLEDFN